MTARLHAGRRAVAPPERPRAGVARRRAMHETASTAPMASLLSPAQLVGLVALVLGVAAFLQRDDRRLKVLLVGECLAYVVHFALLGVPSASSAAGVNALRTLLSIRFRSAWLAAGAIAVNLAFAVALGARGTGWIPVVGSSMGAVAVFTLRGIPMRLLMLASTASWIVNNVVTGSVGGTVLESFIAAASLSTVVRMALAAREAQGAEPA